MSGLVIERPLDWANRRSADRIVAVAVLGIRPLRYVGEGLPPAAPVIESLRINAVGCAEVPTFHISTGLYGFLRLAPGTQRIEITDGARRVLPWAITVAAPDRSPIRQALEKGGVPPALPPPTLVDVALRPAPDAATAPGLTAVWGVVRGPTNEPVRLARIACATVGGGSVVTYSQRDGSFIIILPGEKPSRTTPIQTDFPRALTLHAPTPLLAAALAGPSFVGAMPANLDTVDPDASGGPFQSQQYRLSSADGTVLSGSNPNLPVRAAERSRWDIELLP